MKASGLGDRFLGHVERCRVLLHLVDGTGEHAGEAYKTVRAELEAYGHGLADKPEIVALDQGRRADARSSSSSRPRGSSAPRRRRRWSSRRRRGTGVPEALRALARIIDGVRDASGDAAAPRPGSRSCRSRPACETGVST